MKKMYKQNKSAFTLIELLVVIAIIGILTALAVVSLQNSRRSARDAKRLSDVKQIQIALELYYQDNSSYPPTLIPGETLSSNTVTYMETIPYPPTTLDGDCSTTSYIYSTSNDNTYYNIHFCISNNIGSLPAGEVVASPRGLGTWTCGERLLDNRDNQSYATIQIGSQCWMQENLNYDNGCTSKDYSSSTDFGWCGCYKDLENNCDIYGKLYQQNAVRNGETGEEIQGICPDDWHVPTDNEWKILEMYLGMSQAQADGYNWRGTNEGSKLAGNELLWVGTSALEIDPSFGSSGFNALPAGDKDISGNYYNLGSHVFFRTSSSYYHELYSGYATIYRSFESQGFDVYGISVRCIKNN